MLDLGTSSTDIQVYEEVSKMLILSGLIVCGLIAYGLWQITVAHQGGVALLAFGSLVFFWAWLIWDELEEQRLKAST